MTGLEEQIQEFCSKLMNMTSSAKASAATLITGSVNQERIGALLVQASCLFTTAACGEAAPSATELPNILRICSHIHAMAMVAVRENDQHEYLQNLYRNLAWGAAHLQDLLEWAESQGGNPWGETPKKKPRNRQAAAIAKPAPKPTGETPGSGQGAASSSH